MASNPRRSNGAARDKIRARWKAIGDPCHICGRPIDYSLGYEVDPRTGRKRWHPMSFVVDEIVPVSRGGNPLDFSNTQPAHRICNARKGNKMPWQMKRRKPPSDGPIDQPVEF